MPHHYQTPAGCNSAWTGQGAVSGSLGADNRNSDFFYKFATRTVEDRMDFRLENG